MVHRPTDSRLLVNLLSQEKDYSKQLYILLAAADASVASLSAYAASSPPPASQTILKVAGSLASADDALRRYASSVDEWREKLKSLKTLEEEVMNIIRDREILVTRVIKASRQKQHPSNGNLVRSKQYSSSSSLSTNKSEFSGKGPIPGSSKLANAQSQLQACEAQLATKERELAMQRSVIVKAGLDNRFQAMISCGWAWGEIGKEALRSLEELNALIDEQSSRPGLGSSRPSSDLSSIGPSQSASQVNVPPPIHASIFGILHPEVAGQPPPSPPPGLQNGHHQNHSDDSVHLVMTLPPAHAITDIGLPVAVSVDNNHTIPSPPPSNSSHDNSFLMPLPHHHQSASAVSVKSLPLSQAETNGNGPLGAEDAVYRRHVLSRRITEEELDSQAIESSSEDIHASDNLTAVDNVRFAKNKSKKQNGNHSDTSKPKKQNGDHSDTSKSTKQERRGSLLGSLRGLFGHHSRGASTGGGGNQQESGSSTHTPTPGGLTGLFGGGRKSKWETRTDRNLRTMNDKSDDERDRAIKRPAPGRKTRRLRRASDSGGSRRMANGDVESDVGASEVSRQTRKDSKSRMGKKRSMSVPPVTSAGAPADGVGDRNRVSSVAREPPHSSLPRSTSITKAREAPLRRPSVASASSVPISVGTTKQAQVGRRVSLNDKSMAEKKDGHGRAVAGDGHVRSGSTPMALDGNRGRGNVPHTSLATSNGATASASLMSIIEDVARANREAEAKLRGKKNLSLVDLVPEAESTLSLTSSTLTVRPGSPSPLGSRSSRVNVGGVGTPQGPTIFVPRAPQSVSRQDLEAMKNETDLLARSSGDIERQARPLFRSPKPLQVPATVATQPYSIPPGPEEQKEGSKQTKMNGAREGPLGPIGSPGRRPAQPPLRSALKNPTSRSASPAPLEVAAALVVAGPSRPSQVIVETPMMANGRGSEDDDSASISSYETGHEMFLEEEASPEAHTEAKEAGDEDQIGISSPPSDSVLSGASTGTPQRKKSVRVSLQPTFSPTPPAVDDDDDDEGPQNVWGKKPVTPGVRVNGWIGKRQDDQDVWENSSDEDEEYANAKRLLRKVSESSATGNKGW